MQKALQSTPLPRPCSPQRRLVHSALAAGLIALGAFVSQHAVAASGCTDLRGREIRFNLDWQRDIKPLINEIDFITGKCTSCHNNGQRDGNLDLTDENADGILKMAPYIDPGFPNNSYVFEKINCDAPASGTRMPASQPGTAGTPLSLEEQELIYDWIWPGAKGEPTDEPSPFQRSVIFRDGTESLRWY